MELFTIVIFFIVIAITAVVFFGWVVFMIFRGIIGALVWTFGGNSRPMLMRMAPAAKCSHPGCGQMNPATARFCRRCGRGLVHVQHAHVRRAAVW